MRKVEDDMWGAFIYGTALAISGGKRALRNAEKKANSNFILPNGIKYWVDICLSYGGCELLCNET